MDSDDAGQNAVERLCSSNILSKVPNLNRNELYVATFPSLSDDVLKVAEGVAVANQLAHRVKDPSDYVAQCSDDACTRFYDEVLRHATPWDEWYIGRILSRHSTDAKDGTPGSFSALCEDVSTFLATFSNPAERTRRVAKIGLLLVGLIEKEEEEHHDRSGGSAKNSERMRRSASALDMLRVQLESDLLNMSSRKAAVREAIERRIESLATSHEDKGQRGVATAAKIAELSHGHNAKEEDDNKKSKSALRALPPLHGENMEDSRAKSGQFPAAIATRSTMPPPSVLSTRRKLRKGRQWGSQRRKLPEGPLVPHFDGFTYRHQTDRDWLGFSTDGVSHSNEVHSILCCFLS